METEEVLTDIVLDIDGTLIAEGDGPDDDRIIHRPYLVDFLAYCRAHFKVHIWTAAEKVWADKVLATIPGEFASVRCGASRKYNYRTGECRTIKYLTRYYDRHRTLIVDNTPSTFRCNYGNAVYIKTFVGLDDLDDSCLLETIDRIEYIRQAAKGSVRRVSRPPWYESWVVPRSHAHAQIYDRANDLALAKNQDESTEAEALP